MGNMGVMRRAMMAAVLGLAVSGAAWPALGAPGDATAPVRVKKPENTTPVSRLRIRGDELTQELAGMMAAGAAEGDQKDPRINAAKISYRILIKTLYEDTVKAKSEDVRAACALKADTLAAGTTAFDQLVEQLPTWVRIANAAETGPAAQKIKAKAAAAIQALAAFEKSGEKLGQAVDKPEDVRKLLGETLKTLEPLVTMEIGDQAMPAVWAVRKNGAAVIPPAEMPTVDATVARVQGSGISLALKRELLAVLPKMREEMADPAKAGAATGSYRAVLNCVSLAEKLAATTSLDYAGREALSQRLLLGLILFKDPRTRPDAQDRMEEVGNLAATLGMVDDSHFAAGQKQVLGAAMQQAVAKLPNPGTADAGRGALRNVRDFVAAYERMLKASEQTPASSMKGEWAKVKTAGDALAAAAVETLGTSLDPTRVPEKTPGATTKPLPKVTLEEATARLARVNETFDRLASMPAAEKGAEAIKPGLETLADRKMVLWARAMAAAPDVGPGSTDKDPAAVAARDAMRELHLFQRAVTLLTELRATVPSETTPEIMRLTGGRYEEILKGYRATEGKLVTALGAPGPMAEALIGQLDSESRPLRAAGELAGLMPMETSVGKLNAWAAWELDEPALKMLAHEMTLAVRAEFRAKGAPADEVDDPLVPLAQSGDALRVLARLVRKVTPELGATGTWTATYAQVMTWPEGVLMDQTDALARACYLLNDAGRNAVNEVPSATKSRLGEAVKIIGSLRF